jgi:hypothetical protein
MGWQLPWQRHTDHAHGRGEPPSGRHLVRIRSHTRRTSTAPISCHSRPLFCDGNAHTALRIGGQQRGIDLSDQLVGQLFRALLCSGIPHRRVGDRPALALSERNDALMQLGDRFRRCKFGRIEAEIQLLVSGGAYSW